ncbi:hypothetical protein H7K14_00115 [Mycolicibacter longobardus]|uniref:hypothetical protein n=1 Tax=Mycolicibacter longobardus TaxID=1108812 RepID=UPI0021F37922|nr:hypothetical protein [Mycolicibacter longobardus]MCV7382233.1 hypothetical protein [Mycolicibacter longobardus]
MPDQLALSVVTGRWHADYPERGHVEGRSVVNADWVDEDDYLGLAEQEALDKARRENKPARVVERDGKHLPVTMDLIPGRLNFSVKDGAVYKVDIEG